MKKMLAVILMSLTVISYVPDSSTVDKKSTEVPIKKIENHSMYNMSFKSIETYTTNNRPIDPKIKARIHY